MADEDTKIALYKEYGEEFSNDPDSKRSQLLGFKIQLAEETREEVKPLAMEILNALSTGKLPYNMFRKFEMLALIPPYNMTAESAIYGADIFISDAKECYDVLLPCSGHFPTDLTPILEYLDGTKDHLPYDKYFVYIITASTITENDLVPEDICGRLAMVTDYLNDVLDFPPEVVQVAQT